MNRYLLLSTVVVFTTLFAAAQNISPYWSLAGNNNAAASSKLGTTNSVPLKLVTNNLSRVYIDQNGKVGIGTTTPVTTLHVNRIGAFGNRVTVSNSPRALNLADDNAVMRILRTHASFAPAVELISRTTADGPNVAYWDMYAEPSDKSFRIRDRQTGSNLDRLTIDHDNGYVGIGTTMPGAPLDVSSGSADTVLHVINTFTGFEDRTGIYAQSDNSPEYGFNYGIGVEGVGGNIGLKGTGSTGVYGSGIPISEGFYGTGVYGYGTPGLAGEGVYDGEETFGTGVIGTGYTGVYGFGVAAGVEGYGIYNPDNVHLGTGVYGTGYTGVSGTGAYDSDIGDYVGTGVYAFGLTGIYASTSDNFSSYAGYFDGDVYTTGTYQGSDSKLKQNVADISSAMDVINKLQPKTYEYRQEGNFKLMNLPTGKHYGLIAQDVEQILPHLVKETKFNTGRAKPVIPKPVIPAAPLRHPLDSAKGKKALPVPIVPQMIKAEKGEEVNFKAVNYTELIPILVKAVQELDKKTGEIANLKKEMAELRSLLSKGNNSLSMNVSGAFLEQNAPNPARGTTLIRYQVAESAASVRLNLTNSKGQLLKTLNITGRGTGQINLDTAALPAGVYSYTLWVDGRDMDTKQLVISR